MDAGPTFVYQYCPLCPYESRKTNISPKTFKRDFSIWQLLGLKRTLLSKLHHIGWKVVLDRTLYQLLIQHSALSQSMIGFGEGPGLFNYILHRHWHRNTTFLIQFLVAIWWLSFKGSRIQSRALTEALKADRRTTRHNHTIRTILLVSIKHFLFPSFRIRFFLCF